MIRPEAETTGRQQPDYFLGVSGETCGSTGLAMRLVVVPYEAQDSAMRRPAAAVVAALLALAAGCGGGGGERLSRDADVTKADVICLDVVREQKALPAPASIAEIPAYVDRVLPIFDAALKQLRALRPPAEMEDGVSAWLKAAGDARKALENLRSAAKGGDALKVREAGAEATKIDNRGSARARALGLTACANA